MSNLKLPNMGYEYLSRIAPADKWKKIAYQTFIQKEGNHVLVKHFDTTIATINKDSVSVDNGGYCWSRSTSARLNTIIRQNGAFDKWIGIREGNMVVLGEKGKIISDLSSHPDFYPN